jgi:hypothetical protein
MSHCLRVFRSTDLLMVGILAFLASSAGCNFSASVGSTPTDKDKPAAKTPATPKAALIQFNEGLCTGDEDKLLKAAQADDQQKEFLKAVTGMVKVGNEFRDAFIKAYGQDAWKRFNDPNIDPGNGEGNAHIDLPDLKDRLAKIEKATIEEKGNEAFAEMADAKGEEQHWRMVKVEGGWVVDAAKALIPEGTDVPKLTQQMRNLTPLIAKHKKAIGKPGITADDIDVQMGREIVKELTGVQTRGRPRYDVDKLP